MGTNEMKGTLTIAAMASLLTMALGGAASAQTQSAAPSVHPLTFVQTATACVHTDPMNAPTEWSRLLQRAQIWSLIYGASVAEAFAKKPASKSATCAADMKRLATELPKAETNIFAPNWRTARTNPSAAVLVRLDPAYAASWCIAVAREVGERAQRSPSSIGLDSRSEQSRTQIASLHAELDGLVLAMGEWERTSTWTRATKGKPLDYTFLSRQAGFDYDGYWRDRDSETEKAVLRAAKVAFAGEGGSSLPDVLVNRLRLNVELGACRATRRWNE